MDISERISRSLPFISSLVLVLGFVFDTIIEFTDGVVSQVSKSLFDHRPDGSEKLKLLISGFSGRLVLGNESLAHLNRGFKKTGVSINLLSGLGDDEVLL